MKKEMETVYKNKDNVVYTISNDLNSCYDIDVPDDVETVMLGIREDETIRTGALILAFNLVKSEKSFPNVKKLINNRKPHISYQYSECTVSQCKRSDFVFQTF